MIVSRAFIVSADHVSPKYQLHNATVNVQSPQRFLWWVHLSPYGCSKDYSHPRDAIYNLLRENGCTNIAIKEAIL
jgi:hypothetical protein